MPDHFSAAVRTGHRLAYQSYIIVDCITVSDNVHFFISELLILSINVVKSILGIVNSSLHVIFFIKQDNHNMKGISLPTQ